MKKIHKDIMTGISMPRNEFLFAYVNYLHIFMAQEQVSFA